MSVCKKSVVYVVQNGESFESVFSEFRFAEDYVQKCPGNECRSVIRVELQEGFCEKMPPSQEVPLQPRISTKLTLDEKEAFELMFNNIYKN